MPIVSDAGPILSFARSGLLELLRSVVGELIIPTAVQNELWTRGRTKIAVAVANEEWIKEQRVLNRSLVEILPRKLHAGEREAIVLAQELGVALLVDDSEARKEAWRQGIAHFGSLRVLKEAKARSLIAAVKPALDGLVSS